MKKNYINFSCLEDKAARREIIAIRYDENNNELAVKLFPMKHWVYIQLNENNVSMLLGIIKRTGNLIVLSFTSSFLKLLYKKGVMMK